MPHHTPLISTIVAGLVLAFILGAIANRFRVPPLVGYLIAGVLVGPHTPGFVADAELAVELSEIGVILLMFGVGLHFSLRDLLSVRAIAIPGALVQILGATGMGWGLATLMGWPLGGGLIFGLALSVASTVVLLKAMQDRRLIETEKGRIAVGWLIVEDLLMVLALVLIPAIASVLGAGPAPLDDPFVNFATRLTGIEFGIYGIIAITVLKLAAFVGFMLVVGRRVIPFLLHYTAHTGSRELFRLAVLAIALGVAAGAAYLFGVSLALGAFFAGMILSESELSHRAAQESLPLRDAFAVLFFVSVGMLFDPLILLEDPLPVLGTVFIILIGKSVLAFLIVVAFGRPVATALTISASLAQIGEFSFILAALGVGLGLLPPEGRDLILAGAIISIILNPLLFFLVDLLRPGLERQLGQRLEPALAGGPRLEPDLVASVPAPAVVEAELDDAAISLPTTKREHCVLVGYGRVGAVVADALAATRRSFVIIEDADARILAARDKGFEVIVGNAASSKVLKLANVSAASTVIIAIPNAFEAGQATEQCRRQNAGALIVARAHSDEEEAHLLSLGANVVIQGDREIGLGMADLVNRDSQATAEIVAADAVEAALAPMAASRPAEPAPAERWLHEPAVEPAPAADPEQLAEAIIAADIQHPDEGPAEPPSNVSAFGEEPDPEPSPPAEPDDPWSVVLPTPPIAPESLPPAEPVVPPPPVPAAAPPSRSYRPSTKPGQPFNPEVPPPPGDDLADR